MNNILMINAQNLQHFFGNMINSKMIQISQSEL